MKMYTYVNYADKCEQAFQFYEDHLGAKIMLMMQHYESPNFSKLPPEFKEALLSIGETTLIEVDIPGAQSMRSAYLSLFPDGINEAERAYGLLSDGGEIFMPMGGGPLCSPFCDAQRLS